MESKKNNTNSLFTNKKGLTDLENEFMVTEGTVRGERTVKLVNHCPRGFRIFDFIFLHMSYFKFLFAWSMSNVGASLMPQKVNYLPAVQET